MSERPRRRRFSAQYKLRILAEADQATEAGAIAALLRREGLYSSRLTQWRRQRQNGELGRREKSLDGFGRDPRGRELAKLRRQNKRLQDRLTRAEKVIEIQGKVSALLRELSLESAEPPRDE